MVNLDKKWNVCTGKKNPKNKITIMIKEICLTCRNDKKS